MKELVSIERRKEMNYDINGKLEEVLENNYHILALKPRIEYEKWLRFEGGISEHFSKESLEYIIELISCSLIPERKGEEKLRLENLNHTLKMIVAHDYN